MNREEKGWDEVHWREGDVSTDDDFGIRWRIDEAVCLLDKMATDCDVDLSKRTGDRNGAVISLMQTELVEGSPRRLR